MNEVATRQQNPVVTFKHNLQRLIDAKELALPSNVSVEAFRNAAVVAVQDNPSILNCSPDSVFKAIRRLAGAGLVPDGREAAIVPFKGQAQALPMVAGLIKTARNSGEVISLWAEVVYEDEEFVMRIVKGEREWDHPFDPMNRKGGQIKGAYAVAKLKDGTIELETMGRDQIEKRRKASASQKGDGATGVWRDWFEEMCKKTVIRALCKRLPMSTDDMRRIMVEDEANETRFKDVTPEEEAPRRNLAQKLREPAPAAEPEILPPDPDWPAVDGEPLDLDEAFPGAAEFTAGAKAFSAGEPWQSCPHMDDREKATNWCGGWFSAEQATGGEE